MEGHAHHDGDWVQESAVQVSKNIVDRILNGYRASM